MTSHKNKIKIAAIGDLHVHESSQGIFRNIFSEISEKANVLVLCGDLTNLGTPKEAENLASDVSSLKIPAVAVLGNHDYESGKQDVVKNILKQAGIKMLEDESWEYENIGFAGVKGFGGGFESYMLGPFGEKQIKGFVDEVIKETLQLEKQLSMLQTDKKVVVMHYSPIKQTCIGEPEEIYPFLGSSRLEEPIDFFNVSAVFHGHAHLGSPTGKTLRGVPVYNCSITVLEKLHGNQPFALIEI